MAEPRTVVPHHHNPGRHTMNTSDTITPDNGNPADETEQETVVNTAAPLHGRLTESYVTVNSVQADNIPARTMTIGLSGNTRPMVAVLENALLTCGVTPRQRRRTHIEFHDTKISKGTAPWLMLPAAIGMLCERGKTSLDGLGTVFAFGAVDMNGRVLPVGDVRGMTSIARRIHADTIIAPPGTPAVPGMKVRTIRTLIEAYDMLAVPEPTAR